VLVEHRRMDVCLPADGWSVAQLRSDQLARERDVAPRFRIAARRTDIREDRRRTQGAAKGAQVLRSESLAQHVTDIPVHVLGRNAAHGGRGNLAATWASGTTRPRFADSIQADIAQGVRVDELEQALAG